MRNVKGNAGYVRNMSCIENGGSEGGTINDSENLCRSTNPSLKKCVETTSSQHNSRQFLRMETNMQQEMPTVASDSVLEQA
ncbi:hypothetical protein TURU_036343 [Turdus rufiventris]|nr:hypothetical protein TURU_036343 [Turdus rufiventris]